MTARKFSGKNLHLWQNMPLSAIRWKRSIRFSATLPYRNTSNHFPGKQSPIAKQALTRKPEDPKNLL